MELAVQIFWWIGLVTALLLTLVLLKQVFLVVRVLVAIDELAGYTRDAAAGVARHLRRGELLKELQEPLGRFADASGALSASTAEINAQTKKIKGRS